MSTSYGRSVLIVFMCCITSVAVHTHDRDDLFSAVYTEPVANNNDDGSGVGYFSDSDDDLNLPQNEAPLGVISHDPANDAPLNPALESCPESVEKKSVLICCWQSTTRGQFWGLAGMVAIVGYGFHQLCTWYKKNHPIAFNVTQHDIKQLHMLKDAMHDDIEQLKTGSRKLTTVNLVDLANITPQLANECRAIVDGWMSMYKQCISDQRNIDMLEEFYAHVCQAIKEIENDFYVGDMGLSDQ